MFSNGDVIDVKRKNERELLKRKNICGIGVGYKITAGRTTGDFSIIALATRKVHYSALSSYDLIPSVLEGIKTDVIEVGVIRAPPTVVIPMRQTPLRPAPGGCSIGHYRISAGTLGCLVKKAISTPYGARFETFILSNNHVLADENRGLKGDPILQPGPADGGMLPQHKIAELEEFVPISFTGVNRVDAAIAKPINPTIVTDYIIGVGTPRGTARANLGTRVVKSGRTTGVTRGSITITDATIDVEYSGGKKARFENQLVMLLPRFSWGGDSGSAVLIDDGTGRICGLLFAGSEYATVINPIEEVFSVLGLHPL